MSFFLLRFIRMNFCCYQILFPFLVIVELSASVYMWSMLDSNLLHSRLWFDLFSKSTYKFQIVTLHLILLQFILLPTLTVFLNYNTHDSCAGFFSFIFSILIYFSSLNSFFSWLLLALYIIYANILVINHKVVC